MINMSCLINDKCALKLFNNLLTTFKAYFGKY